MIRLILIAAWVACVTAASAATTIENSALSLSVADDGVMTVVDKRCGVTWRQGVPKGAKGLGVKSAEKTGPRAVAVRLAGTRRLVIELDAMEPEVSVTLEPGKDTKELAETDRLDVMLPFFPPSKDSEIVWTNRAGALYPVTERVFGPAPWVVGGKEMMMCWFGIVDARCKAGMMTIVDTPDDAHVEFRERDGLWAPGVRWLPSRGRIAYPRRLIHRFFDIGGYVAQAKHYRAYKIAQGEFRTLREKAEHNPWVDKLIGGVGGRIIHNNVGLSREYLTRLPEYGIHSGPLTLRAKDDLEGVMTPEVTQTLIDQGFLLMHWYTTAWALPNEPDTLLTPQYMKNPRFTISRTGGYLTKVSKKKGEEEAELPESGFTRLCSHDYLNKATQFLDRMNQLYPMKPKGFSATCGLKIDMLCEDLFECYAPGHELTRSQDKAERIEALAALKQRGFILSAEGGNDWQVPWLEHAYDPLGLQRAQQRRIASATWSIKYPVDPGIGPQYDEYYFGATKRVPLYDLVYHDCIVGTLHDADSFNMYYKTREEDAKYWRLKELLSILHGQAPNFYLTVDEFFEEQHARIKQSIDLVCPWHEKVGYDEMVDHEYLTDDRMVQQTRFSSGWTAIVNFSETETFVGAGGVKIGPLDFAVSKRGDR